MRISDWSSDVCSSDLRGELEISDVNNAYLAEGRLEVCKLPFSTEWFDVGTFDALLDAQTWVAGQQRRKGLLIGSPETAAHREGFITDDELRALAAALDNDGDPTGRASCRERVSQYGWIPVVAGSLKKKNTK